MAKRENRDKIVYVRFNDQEFHQLATLADQNGIDRSNVIRLALRTLVAASSASGDHPPTPLPRLFYDPETKET